MAPARSGEAGDGAKRFALGDSSMVEQRTLTPLMSVRLLVPQPHASTDVCCILRAFAAARTTGIPGTEGAHRPHANRHRQLQSREGASMQRSRASENHPRSTSRKETIRSLDV